MAVTCCNKEVAIETGPGPDGEEQVMKRNLTLLDGVVSSTVNAFTVCPRLWMP